MIRVQEGPYQQSVEGDPTFRLLFDPNPLPMLAFDDRTLVFLAVNDAAVQKYGWSREEFFSMTIEDVWAADELPRLRAYRVEKRHDRSSGLNQAVAWRHRTKDGVIFSVESSWHTIPYHGRTAVLLVMVDLTEKKRAEERSREQASLLDLAADAILVQDLQQRILFWNRGAERLYGWTRIEALGVPITKLFEKKADRLAEAQAELRARGVWVGEVEQISKDGRKVIVSSSWTLVRDERGAPKSVLVINTDITETKKLEAQFLRAQRLEAIGTLASGIAHDLNNILSPILMSVGILRGTVKDPDSERMLSIIEGSAERGAGIVKQVLTFARGVEGERVLVQAKHLLGELDKIMAQTFPRNLDIQLRVAPDLWPLNGDATQLHQVLLNLCVNARDAMPAGGGLVVGAENVQVDEHFASMNPGAQLGPHIVMRVSDTGSGISPETMEKIFDPFFTTKEVGKGTGLGLATVVGIVKSHAGFLTVQSEIGIGTSFKVYLPASPDEQAVGKTRDLKPVTGGRGELILVVDDEKPIREALVRTLQSNGYRAYTAEDGTDALALYFQRRNEIDVVITDILMGQMDGVTLVRSLRRLDPKVRVIASSGHMQKETITILTGLGVNTFLDKPYTAEKLLRAVTSVLQSEPGPKR